MTGIPLGGGGKSTQCSPSLSYLFSTSELNRAWNQAVASGTIRDSLRTADIKAAGASREDCITLVLHNFWHEKLRFKLAFLKSDMTKVVLVYDLIL